MNKIVILSWWTWDEREVALKSVEIFRNNIDNHDFYILPEQLDDFLANRSNYIQAVPVFHGEYGEDGKIFAMLDLLEINYNNTSYASHSLCLDKVNTNIIAKSIGLNVPDQSIVDISNNHNSLERFPIIMKPNTGWSSFHTYKINNQSEFDEKLSLMKKDCDDEILIQDFVVWDEYSVSFVDWETLPIMKLEKQNKEDFFDYESKYESEEIMKETFPLIEDELRLKLESDTLKICKHFNIIWYARIDFLVRSNDVYFLEVNTIPGTTKASILPKAWRLAGRSDGELIEKLTNLN